MLFGLIFFLSLMLIIPALLIILTKPQWIIFFIIGMIFFIEWLTSYYTLISPRILWLTDILIIMLALNTLLIPIINKEKS